MLEPAEHKCFVMSHVKKVYFKSFEALKMICEQLIRAKADQRRLLEECFLLTPDWYDWKEVPV